MICVGRLRCSAHGHRVWARQGQCAYHRINLNRPDQRVFQEAEDELRHADQQLLAKTKAHIDSLNKYLDKEVTPLVDDVCKKRLPTESNSGIPPYQNQEIIKLRNNWHAALKAYKEAARELQLNLTDFQAEDYPDFHQVKDQLASEIRAMSDEEQRILHHETKLQRESQQVRVENMLANLKKAVKPDPSTSLR